MESDNKPLDAIFIKPLYQVPAINFAGSEFYVATLRVEAAFCCYHFALVLIIHSILY